MDAATITAIGAIVIAIVTPFINSLVTRKDKRLDLMLKKQEREFELRLKKMEEDRDLRVGRESAKLNQIISDIFGYLHDLRHVCRCDRTYIIQPHPLPNRQYISVSFEVKNPNRDVVAHKAYFQYKKMSEWAALCKMLANRDWIVFNSLTEIDDPMTYAEAKRRGLKMIVFKQLITEDGYWEGTLCMEYTYVRPSGEEVEKIKSAMTESAKAIQYILPPYEPELF